MNLSKLLVDYCLNTSLVEVDKDNAKRYLKKNGIPDCEVKEIVRRKRKEARGRIILCAVMGMIVGGAIVALIEAYSIGSVLILILSAIGLLYLGALTAGILLELQQK